MLGASGNPEPLSNKSGLCQHSTPSEYCQPLRIAEGRQWIGMLGAEHDNQFFVMTNV